MFTPDSLLQFLRELFTALKIPFLIFAIAIIIILSLFGEGIPQSYELLVYIVAIAVLFMTLFLEIAKAPKQTASTTMKDVSLHGAILYINVKNFSRLSDTDQDIVGKILQDELTHFLGSDSKNLFEEDGKYWVEFLGGDLILFIQDEYLAQNIAITNCLMFGLHLQLLSRELPYDLSVTLNWGENLRVANIFGVKSLYGRALHVTRSMIAFTEGAHFLISDKVEEQLTRNLLYSGRTGACDRLVKAIKNEASHSVSLKHITPDSQYQIATVSGQDFYNFFIVDEDENLLVGNNINPPDRAAIDFRNDTLQKTDTNHRLIEYLRTAEDVVLMDITHDGLVDYLRIALDERNNRFWESISVIFPNQANINNLIKKGGIFRDENLQIKENMRKVQIFFESQDNSLINKWNCLEYKDDLPFIGQRFIQKNSGMIRLGVIFAGERPIEIPYFEVKQQTKTFEQFSRVFDHLLAGSTSISEWDLFGGIIKDEDGTNRFAYRGIVNRPNISVELKKLPDFSELWFPVVLIMLYTERFGDYKSVIQERTSYNATTDIGTFSNISGRVSTDDVRNPNNSGNVFTVTFDSSLGFATDEFNKFSGWTPGVVLSEEVWKNAAVRELGEELGLDIDLSRLKYRGEHFLQRNDGNLYFKIYSLLLQSDKEEHELEIIRQRRPYVSVKQCSFKELENLWRNKKLNRLLQRKFLELFVPIFSELQIKDSPPNNAPDITSYIEAMKRIEHL